MPWKEFKNMDQREQFVRDYLTGAYPKGALCAVYGISRPTGGQVAGAVSRARGGGPRGLARRPHTQPLRPAPIALVLAAMLTFGASPAAAQTTNVCPDPGENPEAGERIVCLEDSTSTDDITINADSVDIATTSDNEYAIYGKHEGDGNININVGGTSMIDTSDSMSHGIYGRHQGTGNILIKAENGVNVVTEDPQARGVFASHSKGTGDVTIRVKGVDGAKTITTGSRGVSAENYSKGNTEVTVTDVNIMTTDTGDNSSAYGVEGVSSLASFSSDPGGPNNVNINVIGSQIFTMGGRAPGIIGAHRGTNSFANEGDLEITATKTEITTAGVFGTGILGQNLYSNGNVIINMTDGFIRTAGREAPGITGTASKGITMPELGYIRIKVKDALIETTGVSTNNILAVNYGVHAGNYKDGKGYVDITLEGSTITTYADAVYGERNSGTGDIMVNAIGGSLTTKGAFAHGIYAHHQADGDIIIDTRNVDIETQSTDLYLSAPFTLSSGIYGRHQGTGNIDIDVQGGTIMTWGVSSYGIWARHQGDGNLMVDTSNGNMITTTGDDGHGIVAYHYGTMDTRRMAITVGGDVDASGAGAHGVRVGRTNPDNGLLAVAALDAEGYYRKQTVTVNGSVMGEAAGVWLAGGGRVVIGPEGTIGAQSGIAILATGTVPEVPAPDSDRNNVAAIPAILPKLRVDLNLGGRQKVADALLGNWIINDGGETTIAVNGTVLHDGIEGVVLDENDDPVKAQNGVWDVTMREHGFKVDHSTAAKPDKWMRIESTSADKIIADRDFSAADFNEPDPPPPPPSPSPPMPQTVMVDEPVFGDADDVAGVHLPAGGRVLIGPRGTVGGKSGIAILAEGDAPMLHVDLRLDGRRVRDVIGDDWIINDGGETTIVVNDVTLHDGAMGVVEDAVAPNGGNVRVTQRGRRATGVVKDAMAPNGAFNVTMRPEGVTVLDRSDPDPANWVITEPVGGVVADRDFSTEDFIETSTQPMFTEEYAPRAALYEILPDFLLRLTGPGPSRRCGSTPDSSVWTRVAGGQGVYESDRSTTGATYDLERFEAEGGLSASLGARAKGWVSVRHVQGTAGVASPTGGGEIDVRGLGSSVGGSWQGANDVYAVGCFSYLAYDVDFASTRQGVLKAGVDGQAYTLDLEVGRRYAVGEQAQLTPRVWVMGSRVSVDDFTDAVDARVSLANAARVLVGLGVQADTTRPWAGGAFLLRGSVDIEQMVSGATTTTQVSGERLSADATDTSLLFGLRGIYRHDRVTVGAELAARQELGSTDSEYTSFLNLGLSF